MDRKEAAERIKRHMIVHQIGSYPHIKLAEALNMAIAALQEPEIVRCKDCKHWIDDYPYSNIVKKCELAGYMVGEKRILRIWAESRRGRMKDDDRYDCDFSLEEQVEASNKHFTDLEDEYCQSKDKYIKLSDLQKFPIRLNHYDEVNGSLKYVFGIENVIEYAECLPRYYLDNIISELEDLYDLANENQKLAVKQAIEIVRRNFKETEENE